MTSPQPFFYPSSKCQSTTKFSIQNKQQLIISSEFDSGHIQVLKQVSNYEYRLSAITDNENSEYEANSKSWFYFSVEVPIKSSMSLQNSGGKYALNQGKYENIYRPVVKQNNKWQRLKTQCKISLKHDDTVLVSFDYLFSTKQKVFFAFCYPFSYQENINYIQSLNRYTKDDTLYYHQQQLIYSPQNRKIHLLTITSNSQNQKGKQPKFNNHLFPQNNRPKFFNKPVVLISARVHPGQTPSSFSMIGIIDFLLSTDLRAFILRQMFVFMIIPMINVDGVYRGNFRMDLFGQNLNRYYIQPDCQKQPAPYAIKKLAQYLHQNKRLSFFFDLHAHNSKKGCFIYGNAIDNFVDQVQSNTFCKIISMNTKFFQYEECTFSTKHMKIKDKNQDLTKQGCARVVMHKLTGIIHSYSLQCGLISSNNINDLSEASNKQFEHKQYKFIEQDLESNTNPIFSNESPLYTQQMYKNVGKALMVSILDTFDKNPFSRIITSNFKSISELRKTVSYQVFREAERFRMLQKNSYHKSKNIQKLMIENFKQKFNNQLLNIQYSINLKNIIWPVNIIGLQKIKKNLERFSPNKHYKSSSTVQKQTFLFSTFDQFQTQQEQKLNLPLKQKQQKYISLSFPIKIPSTPKVYLKVPNIFSDNLSNPLISSISKQINQKDLKDNKDREKQQSKEDLFDEHYPFGDRSIRLSGHNSLQLPSNLIFNKQRSKSNVINIHQQKNNIYNKKLQPLFQKDSQISKLTIIHKHLNRLSNIRQKPDHNKQLLHRKRKQRSLEVCLSDSLIKPNIKTQHSNLKLFHSILRRQVKLPRLQSNTQQFNKKQQLNTVQLDLIEQSIPYRSQRANKYDSKIRLNPKTLNRLKKLKK